MVFLFSGYLIVRTDKFATLHWRFLEPKTDCGQAGKDREDDRKRKDPEYERHHHADFLLAGGLHELSLGRVPDILCLRPEDVCEGRSALDSHDHSVHETDQRALIGPG